MGENEIRSNWDRALEKVENGSDLSSYIEWGFSGQDLLVLCFLHHIGKHRMKIEDLLEDCNFHTECSLLRKRDYKKYLDLAQRDFF